MSGLRKQKNDIKSEFAKLRDEVFSAIDGDTLTIKDGEQCGLHLDELFTQYHEICADLDSKYQVYEEGEKCARLQREGTRLAEDYNEVIECLEKYSRKRRVMEEELLRMEMEEREKIQKRHAEKEHVATEMDNLVEELERTLLEARARRTALYTQVGIVETPKSTRISGGTPQGRPGVEELPDGAVHTSHTLLDDVVDGMQRQDLAGASSDKKQFQPTCTSTPYQQRDDDDIMKKMTSLQDYLESEPQRQYGAMGTQREPEDTPRRLAHVQPKPAAWGRREPEPEPKYGGRGGEVTPRDYSANPERFLKRVSLRTFTGKAREFEAWFAHFHENVGKHDSIPDHQKLVRLYDCLDGKALQSVETMGYVGTAYPIVMARLRRKYGGPKREMYTRMEDFDKFKGVRDNNAEDLEALAEILDSILVKFWTTGQTSELGAGSFYRQVLKKLNRALLVKYHGWQRERGFEESVHTVYRFINMESEIQAEVNEECCGLPAASKAKPAARTGTGRSYVATEKTDAPGGGKPRDRKCKLCQEEHGLWQCKQFRDLAVPERWNKVREFRACFRCLSTWHLNSQCQQKGLCEIDGCKSNHNRLLHIRRGGSGKSDRPAFKPYEKKDAKPESRLSQAGKKEAGSDATPSSPAAVNSGETKEENTYVTYAKYVALRTIPVRLSHQGKSVVINALLDEASTLTYLNEEVADQLNLEGKHSNVCVKVVNDQCVEMTSRAVTCTLSSVDGCNHWEVNAQTTRNVVGSLSVIDWSKQKHKWEHLRDIPFLGITGKHRVDMLIGYNHFLVHDVQEEVKGEEGEPIARLTPLGWTCVAPPPRSAGLHTHFTFLTTTESRMNDVVRNMWELEVSPTCEIIKPDDILAESILEKTIKKLEVGYEVGLPWRIDKERLPDNYMVAESRLRSLERKLIREPALGAAYQKVLQDYVTKGYLVKLTPEEVKERPGSYLAHFAVERPDKDTTKVRVVFDASAACEGISLNDALCTGPNLQNDLLVVLTRFRRYPVAIVSDITEMYLQVRIRAEDRNVLRLLWRDLDVSRKPDVYESLSLIFGVGPAPYMAQKVAKTQAKVMALEYARAAETIIKSTYMDDSMDSVLSVKAAVQLYKDLKLIWSGAGMVPKKWMSNSEEVLRHIPVADRMKQLDLEADVMPTVKTLGVSWNSETDNFTFKVQMPTLTTDVTKRNFLSRTASLFDPLGFVSPFTIRARTLLQEMWAGGYGWDDPVPGAISERAVEWFNELAQLSGVEVPRVLQLQEVVVDSWLHICVDASLEAYGAVVYAVHQYEDGTWSSRFVMSKARVAPVIAISVPRLELMAAIVGVRLASVVGPVLGLPKEKWIFWTDNQDVWYWVRGRSRQFKPFIANRVGEIQLKSEPDSWRYIRTNENPADKLTRGLSAEQLADDQSWWYGPPFIRAAPAEWPAGVPSSYQSSLEKRKKTVVVFTAISCWKRADARTLVDWEKLGWGPHTVSDWFRLLRVFCYMMRFVHHCSDREATRQMGPITVDELQDAAVAFLKSMQREAYSGECQRVLEGNGVPATSKLSSMCPVMDAEGVLRGNSRLSMSSAVSWETKYPALLARKHPVSRLILKRIHEDSQHAGTNHVLSLASARYWMPGFREEIKEMEHRCTVCRKRKAPAAVQIMAPLLPRRSALTLRAFANLSVDYAGPFFSKQGRGKVQLKRYLCVFVCMSTHAIHLEMAYSMDTSSFLNAFYRMVARRGLPSHVTSDNGTNFVGGERELNELVRALDQRKIQESSASQGVRWSFNTPLAPHHNGVHEVMVRAAKRAMNHVLYRADLSDEELASAIVGAEGLINSRPITYRGTNPTDCEPLTPNHFLFNQMGGQFAPEAVDEEDYHPRQRWRRVQEVVKHFWSRWITEWLPSLSARSKWTKQHRDLQVGELVLLLSQDTPRGKWPMGRILQVHPGKDGHVRSADVDVKGTVYTRPIVKLCPLECGG